jgi:hypothetical protein
MYRFWFYDSVRRDLLYNILIDFGIPVKLVRLMKISLNETCSKVQIGKTDAFRIQNGLKQGDALSPLRLKFDTEYPIRKVQENEDRLELNGTHHLLSLLMMILDENISTLKKSTNSVEG